MSKKENKAIIYQENGELSQVSKKFDVKTTFSSGFYYVGEENMGMGTRRFLAIDDSIQLPKSSENAYRIHFKNVEYINSYYSKASRDIHKALNIKHKLGILLYGVQGTGKTTICYSLAKYLIETMGAVVVTVEHTSQLGFALKALKESDHKEKLLKVIIMDECEEAMYQNESYMKKVLDSTSSMNNVLFLFTTNYEERIPDAIKYRPSRIKWTIEIGGYTDENLIYSAMLELNTNLKEEVKLSDKEVFAMVPSLVGKTIDEIKNTFVDKVLKENLRRAGIIEKLTVN